MKLLHAFVTEQKVFNYPLERVCRFDLQKKHFLLTFIFPYSKGKFYEINSVGRRFLRGKLKKWLLERNFLLVFFLLKSECFLIRRKVL